MATLVGDESEEHFMARVRRIAKLYGWVDWHTRDSQGTRAGEPDLRLLRPPVLVYAELKSEHGRVRPEQAAALALLRDVQRIEAHLWRPSDLEQIVATLR